MSFVSSMSELTGDLRSVGENFERDGWRFAKEIQDAWIYEIHLKDVILSGDYLRSIGWKATESSEDFQQYVVDSSSNPDVENYSGFIEGGTENMPARYPAQSAVERVEFVQTIDALIDAGMIHAN